jgi:probable F420-dependent oxidoreductase
MRVDARLAVGIDEVSDRARRYEADGYDGLWASETSLDPFLAVLLASEATEHIQVGTSVAVAFARSPMTVATSANDLQLLSAGRLQLGLGTQVRAHIEDRFSMPWSRPAARMREYVLALQAIWRSWNEQVPLDFRGEFYHHTLMSPIFAPPPNPYGAPKVLVAGVGERMTEVAGELADGFICHAFTTDRYLHEVTVPILARGRARSGRTMDGFEVCRPLFVVTGRTEEAFAAARRSTKQQLAFYASTPTYRPVLERHGWGGLQTELNMLARQGRWGDMADCVTDEVLAAFAVVGEPDQLAPAMAGRLSCPVTRISLYQTYSSDPTIWPPVLSGIRSAAG